MHLQGLYDALLGQRRRVREIDLSSGTFALAADDCDGEIAQFAEAQKSQALSAHPSFFAQPCIELSCKNRAMADRLIAQPCS